MNDKNLISNRNFEDLCNNLTQSFVTKYVGIVLKSGCGKLSICAWQRYGFIMQVEKSEFSFTNHQLRRLQNIINKYKNKL